MWRRRGYGVGGHDEFPPLGIGFSSAGGGDGAGEPWDWDIDWICARLATRGICGGHPLVVKRDLDLRWCGLLYEAWEYDPLASDWQAAEHKFKPKRRKGATVEQISGASGPSYLQILEEFERRTNPESRPTPALPSPLTVFDEFERRTGQKANEDA